MLSSQGMTASSQKWLSKLLSSQPRTRPLLHTPPIYALRHVRGWKNLDQVAFRAGLQNGLLCGNCSSITSCSSEQFAILNLQHAI